LGVIDTNASGGVNTLGRYGNLSILHPDGFRGREVVTVKLEVDPQRLRDYPWPTAKALVDFISLPPPSDRIHPFDGFNGSNENGLRSILFVGYDIKEVVDSVAEIDVAVTPLQKHHFGPLGPAVLVGVAGTIIESIGLHFCNHASGEFSMDLGTENLAEQVPCHLIYIALNKIFSIQSLDHSLLLTHFEFNSSLR